MKDVIYDVMFTKGFDISLKITKILSLTEYLAKRALS